MKRTISLTIVLMISIVSIVFADPGDTLWTRFYGGGAPDFGHSVQQTTDGGFIIAGYTRSFGNGSQAYLVKTDANGDTLWTRAYGGADNEHGNSVQQTSDGGYIVVGEIFIIRTSSWDVYLLKTDADGQASWTRTIGGSDWDHGWSVQQTLDGGYIIAGRTNSYGAGSNDVYLIKTRFNGSTMWTRTFGGTGSDGGNSVQQTSDGGYIITGYTHSFGAGGGDVYLVKTDSDGIAEWTRTYGGSSLDGGYSVQQTGDGGYIIAGRTQSFGAGGYDAYLVKTDANGNALWTRTYGGSGWDFGRSVDQTTDGGYIIAGNTDSFGAGGFDVYLVKTDDNGDTLWTRAYGYSSDDYSLSVQQTTDGGYIAAGYWTTSGPNYNDFYVLRIAGEQQESVISIQMIPDNPPVVVPPGGSFTYEGTLTNNTSDPQTTDVWVMLNVPSYGIYGPVQQFNNVPLAPNQTISVPGITQYVPGYAPPGVYDYIAYCGEYPSSNPIDSASFEFTVTAVIDGGADDWNLSGWFAETNENVPSEFILATNHPNPFNATTQIRYILSRQSNVRLDIYNLAGQRVETLFDGHQHAGEFSVNWDASSFSSGIYFYKLTAPGRTGGDKVFTKRMTLLK